MAKNEDLPEENNEGVNDPEEANETEAPGSSSSETNPSSQDLDQTQNPEQNTENSPQGSSKNSPGGLRGWWRGLSTPIKALLALAGGFILAGALAIVLTTGGNNNIIPDEAPAPAPTEPDPGQQLPDGGSDNRVTGVLISPFAQTVLGNTGSKIKPITVRNGSSQNIKIIVNYVPATRNSLRGEPVYGLSRKTVRQGKKEIRPDVRTFQLAPGSSREVGATIVGKPKTGVGMYGVMLFSIDDGTTSELDEPVAAGVNIRIKRLYRVAAIVNVKFPGAIKNNFQVQRIRATENEEGIQFLTRVRNTGNFINAVGGELTITGSEGIVARIPIAEQGALPGNERDLGASETVQGLPPGRYRADVSLTSGNREAEASWEFRIDENGNLPSPAAAFAMRAEPAIILPDQTYSVRVQLRNEGTKDFSTRGTIALSRTGETDVLKEASVELDSISPGETTDTTVEFPGIPESGNYELVLTAEADDGTALGQRVASVLVRSEVDEATLSERIRDWMSANPLGTMVVGIGIVGLLLLLGIGGYLLLQRRKK